MATASDIADNIATTAAAGIASATVDGQSVQALDLSKQIEAQRAVATSTELAGANPQGGKRSGWNSLRPAKFVPPGC